MVLWQFYGCFAAAAAVLLLALGVCLRALYCSKRGRLLEDRQYAELAAWLNKMGKFRFFAPSISFDTGYAAFLYGDEELFYTALRRYFHSRRSRATPRYLLNCCDMIFALLGNRRKDGFDIYRRLEEERPAKFTGAHRARAQTAELLAEGIAACEAGDFPKAREMLLRAYAKLSDGGASGTTGGGAPGRTGCAGKFVCCLFLSGVFTKLGDEEHAGFFRVEARAFASGTRYAEKLGNGEDAGSARCSSHPEETAVASCIRCGAPVCVKCAGENGDLICAGCRRKELRLRALAAARKDSRNFLIICLAMLAALFAFFTYEIRYIYFEIPAFFRNIPQPYPWNVLILSGLFAAAVAAVFNGIYLFLKFIKNRSPAVKILCAALSVVTLAAVYCAGFIGLVPAVIVSLCRYVRARRQTAKLKKA